MENQIKKLNKWLIEHSKNTKVKDLDESLFNAGVEFGRLLEQKGIEKYEVEFFENLKREKNSKQQFKVIKKNADEILLRFILGAASATILEGKVLSYSWDRRNHAAEKFSTAVVEKYCVQHTKTLESGEYEDFELIFEMKGRLADICQEFGVSNIFRVEFSSNGESQSELVADDDCLDYYLSASCQLNQSEISISDAEKFAQKIDKAYTYQMML